MRRSAGVLLALGLLGPGGVAAAEEIDAPGGTVLVEVDALRGSRTFGTGFARIGLVNRTRRAQRVRVRVSEPAWVGSFAAEGTEDLPADGRVVREIPVPGGDMYTFVEIDVEDGGASQDSLAGAATASRPGGHPSVLHLRPPEREVPRSGFTERTIDALPSRWHLLSAFDVVIVEGDDAGLDAARQEVLRRFLATGGTLVVARAEGLADGPLRRVFDGAPRTSTGTHGFGEWNLRDEADADGLAQRDPSRWMLREAAIPGIGEVPARTFFFMILGFAVLMGPVSYLWLRRRRRLGWLLVSIPAIGFGGAGAILLYGVLVDGLGSKGIVRSLSILDQARGEVSCHATRTIYAGISPGEIRPDPETLLLPLESRRNYGFTRRTPAVGHRVSLDGTVDGSVLPSRTPTTLLTSSRRVARERLRFRRIDDDSFEVLAEPGFAPDAKSGSIVLHLPQHGWFVGDATGRGVRRVLEEDARDAVNALRASIAFRPEPTSGASPSEDSEPFPPPGTPHPPMRDLTASAFRLPGDRGAWVARIPGARFHDEMGLDVEWRASEHVVLGLLGGGDVDG